MAQGLTEDAMMVEDAAGTEPSAPISPTLAEGTSIISLEILRLKLCQGYGSQGGYNVAAYYGAIAFLSSGRGTHRHVGLVPLHQILADGNPIWFDESPFLQSAEHLPESPLGISFGTLDGMPLLASLACLGISSCVHHNGPGTF